MQSIPEVYNSSYLVSLLPLTHPEFRVFAMKVELNRMKGLYVVFPNAERRHSFIISAEGEKVYRERYFDGFGSDTIYFTLEKALEVANKYVHYIVTNGITAQSLLDWEAQPQDYKDVHQNWKDFFNAVADETKTWRVRF